MGYEPLKCAFEDFLYFANYCPLKVKQKRTKWNDSFLKDIEGCCHVSIAVGIFLIYKIVSDEQEERSYSINLVCNLHTHAHSHTITCISEHINLFNRFQFDLSKKRISE